MKQDLRLVLVATAWGPKHGGINALNFDLARNLALLEPQRLKVTCLVSELSPKDITDAKSCGVELRLVPKMREDLAGEVRLLASDQDFIGQMGPATVVVGHDAITGEFACALAKDVDGWRSCVFVHMDYAAYHSSKGDPKAQDIGDDHSRLQHRVIVAADQVVAVGPKLFHAAIRLGADRKRLIQFVPGLSDHVLPEGPGKDRAFFGFLSGRLDPSNDVVKQGVLAVASFAKAVQLLEEANHSDRVQDAVMTLFGVEKSFDRIHGQVHMLRAVADESAGRAITINAHPFTDDRAEMHQVLASQHISLFTSRHDGFGLVGWEAIEHGIPQVLTENCGLARLLEDAGLAHLTKMVDIRYGLDYQKLDSGLSQAGRNRATSNSKEAVAERYLKALHTPDLLAVATAIKETWLNYHQAKDKAIKLRSELLAKGFSWPQVGRSLLASMFPSWRSAADNIAPPALQQKPGKSIGIGAATSQGRLPFGPTLPLSANPGLLMPSGSLQPTFADFEAALREMSDTFARRHIHDDIAGDPIAMARLDEAFKSILVHHGEPIDYPARHIVKRLLVANRTTLHVGAYSGSGREQFFALIYLMLKAEIAASGREIIPVVIDRQLETRTDWSLDERIAQHLKLTTAPAFAKRYIVLIVGNHHWPQNLPDDTARNLTQLKDRLYASQAAVLIANHKSKRAQGDAPRVDADRQYAIIEQPVGDEAIRRLLIIAAASEGIELDSNTVMVAGEALRKLCGRHRTAPDVFITRQVLQSVSSGGAQDESLGGLIASYVDTFIRSRFGTTTVRGDIDDEIRVAGPAVRKYSAAHYRAFTSTSRRRSSKQADTEQTLRDIESGYLELIRTHRSVRDWLVATEVFYSFVDHGSAPSVTATEAADFAARLDHVFPSRITAFLRDYLDHENPETVKAAVDAVCMHLTGFESSTDSSAADRPRERRDLGVSLIYRRFITTCAYIAGRVSPIPMQREMKVALAKVGQLAANDLEDFLRVRHLVREAAEAKSPGIRRWAKDYFRLLGSDAQHHANDVPRALERLEREMLLVQRGIFISRAMLGDTAAAEAYISQLMRNYGHDDLNRGFHREYYGDLDLSPSDPLLSDDKSLTSCARTLAALISELPSSPADRPMVQIQLYTIASLVRRRNIEATMSSSELREVAKFLSTEVRRHTQIPDSLSDFIGTTIAEIECGRHALEAYIDDLYEIKLQKRAGWKRSAPSESVAAHLYMCERLVDLFINKVEVDGPVSKARVVELVRMHDIGEAIASDVREVDKGSVDETNEASIVRRVARIGALTESDEFLQVAEDYQNFESVKTLRPSKITAETYANDIDRLDLLIQFFRYRREHGAVEDESDFRGSIALEKFGTPTIRKWANRFTEYFESDLSHRDPRVPFEQRLWPKGVPRSARIDAC